MKRITSVVTYKNPHSHNPYAHNKWTQGSLIGTHFKLEGTETPSSPFVRNTVKRKEIMNHLNQMAHEFNLNGKTAKIMSMSNHLFDELIKHFIPTIPPTETEAVEELRETIFTHNAKNPLLVDTSDAYYRDPRWMQSYNSTFAILIIRRALKDLGLPVIQASRWKEFARIYFGLVMVA